MRYNELIQLYFERSSAVLSLWTLYVVILGGLLAFSSLRKMPDRITTILLSVLFAVFAYQNLSGLHDAAVQRLAVLEAIRQNDAPDAHTMRTVFEPTLTPVSYGNIRGFHLGRGRAHAAHAVVDGTATPEGSTGDARIVVRRRHDIHEKFCPFAGWCLRVAGGVAGNAGG